MDQILVELAAIKRSLDEQKTINQHHEERDRQHTNEIRALNEYVAKKKLVDIGEACSFALKLMRYCSAADEKDRKKLEQNLGEWNDYGEKFRKVATSDGWVESDIAQTFGWEAGMERFLLALQHIRNTEMHPIYTGDNIDEIETYFKDPNVQKELDKIAASNGGTFKKEDAMKLPELLRQLIKRAHDIFENDNPGKKRATNGHRHHIAQLPHRDECI